jgi:hypothetical protein
VQFVRENKIKQQFSFDFFVKNCRCAYFSGIIMLSVFLTANKNENKSNTVTDQTLFILQRDSSLSFA